MNRHQIRARLERLEASMPMPIGKDRDRDRRRRKWLSSNLFRLTDAQRAELEELNPYFAQEDRERTLTSALASQDRLARKGLDRPLTAEEQKQLADLKQRYPEDDGLRDDRTDEAFAREYIRLFGRRWENESE